IIFTFYLFTFSFVVCMILLILLTLTLFPYTTLFRSVRHAVLDLLPGVAHAFSHRVLAGDVGVGDRQVASLHLGGVAVDGQVHPVATAALGPVVRLIEHQEGGPAAFDRGRVAGDQLHSLAAVVGAPELLARLDAVLLLHLL